MAPKDETEAKRKARYERLGKASAKNINKLLAETDLGDKLRAKGLNSRVGVKKSPTRKGTIRKG
jgi:hypothetical protein